MRPVSRQGVENENGDSMFRTFAAAAALATLPLQASALSVTFESTLGDLQTAIGGPAPVIDDYSTFPPTGYTFSGSFSHDATNEIVTAIGGPANGGETTLTFDSPIGFFAVDTLNLSDNEIVPRIFHTVALKETPQQVCSEDDLSGTDDERGSGSEYLEVLKRRHFLAARRAPRRPEVQDDVAPLVVRQ